MAPESTPRRNELTEGDIVFQGSAKWFIEQTDGPDGTILLSSEATTVPVALRALRHCPCGRLVLGDPPCYMCHFPTSQRPATDDNEDHD